MKPFVFYIQSEELASTHKGWPELIDAAIERGPGGSTLNLFHRDELKEKLSEIAAGLPVYPRVSGFPKTKINFAEETAILAFIGNYPEITDKARGYAADYLFELEMKESAAARAAAEAEEAEIEARAKELARAKAVEEEAAKLALKQVAETTTEAVTKEDSKPEQDSHEAVASGDAPPAGEAAPAQTKAVILSDELIEQLPAFQETRKEINRLRGLLSDTQKKVASRVSKGAMVFTATVGVVGICLAGFGLWTSHRSQSVAESAIQQVSEVKGQRLITGELSEAFMQDLRKNLSEAMAQDGLSKGR